MADRYRVRRAIRYANLVLSGRTGEILIKNFVGAQLPSLLFLAFLPPPFHSSYISTSSPGRQTIFSEFWAERVSASGEGSFSDNHIIHLFTIRLLTAQSAAPAGGCPMRPHHLAPPPSRRH